MVLGRRHGPSGSYGTLTLTPLEGGTRIDLWTETRSALPLMGGLGTVLVNPLFLAPTFGGWLRNLARRASLKRRVPMGLDMLPIVGDPLCSGCEPTPGSA